MPFSSGSYPKRRSDQSERHRGAHPEDPRLFSKEAQSTLRVAAEELTWLLDRGYPQAPALDLVGRHHQLEVRQRQALQRAVCAHSVAESRAERLVPLGELANETVSMDAFNIVITLEVALSGGVLLRCGDDTLRDLAGLRRNYHPVAETDGAIDLIARALHGAKIARARVFIDAPVSNSGRLRERFAAFAPRFGCEMAIEMVPNADRELAGQRLVASGDSGVIDSAESWVNLARAAVAHGVHDAWIVDLG